MKIKINKEFLKELEQIQNNKTWDEETDTYLKAIMQKTNSTIVAYNLLKKYFPNKKFTIYSVQHRKNYLRRN